MSQIFSLRFKSAGSLYLDSVSPHFIVGPIISTPFYRALDGRVRVPSASLTRNANPNRGPFSSVSEYLSSSIRSELEFIFTHRSVALSELQGSDDNFEVAERRLELGERVMKKGVELCSIYPGDKLIPENLSAPETSFSLKLDDFSLSNIMVVPRIFEKQLPSAHAQVID